MTRPAILAWVRQTGIHRVLAVHPIPIMPAFTDIPSADRLSFTGFGTQYIRGGMIVPKCPCHGKTMATGLPVPELFCEGKTNTAL